MDNRHRHLMPQITEINGLKIEAISVGGIGTSISLPQYKVTFDVAQGLPFSSFANIFCITHSHMDHASGIPFIISSRALAGIESSRFLMPKYMVEPLTLIMDSWEKMEGHKYSYEFIGIEPGEEFDIGKGRYIRAFKTFHRVGSQGYSLVEKKKKLKKEFKNLSSNELKNLSHSGETITSLHERYLFSFTGDTTTEFITKGEECVLASEVLMTECTYFGDLKFIERADKWGHLHLNQLAECFDKVRAKKVVLMHLSSRFRSWELEQEVRDVFAKEVAKRIVVFPAT